MALEKKNEGIIMYREYLSYFELLSVEDRGELVTAILKYAFGEEDYESLSPAAKMAFMFITDQINRDTEKYERRCEKNRKNGMLGGRPPKKDKEKSEKGEDRGEDFSDGSYNEDGEAVEDIPDGFEEFIFAYPKKIDREEALKEYRELSPDEDMREKIMEKLRSDKKSENWQKEGGRYVPRASVWLQRREWEKECKKKERIYASAFGVPPSDGSFDTDDFFEASLRRGEDFLNSF